MASLIQQFLVFQAQYPNAIIATEVGGFFEIWEVNGIGYAKKASNLLDTILTRRNKLDLDSPFMTGFPSHVAENYFKKLVECGETVVVVEQTIKGTKSDGNKNVERTITKILSPGTIIDNSKIENNYFASIYSDKFGNGICLLDISTGEVKLTEVNNINDFISKIKPKEILTTNYDYNNSIINNKPIEKLNLCSKLIEHIYDIQNISSDDYYAIKFYNLELYKHAVLAFGNLINYLSQTEYNKVLLRKIGEPKILNNYNYLELPLNGLLSLEIFENYAKTNETLFNCLDNCQTSMGKRKLKEWLLFPIKEKTEIINRQNLVEKYIKTPLDLSNINDISRYTRKMNLGKLEQIEFLNFCTSLKKIISIFNIEKIIFNKNIINYITDNIDVNLINSEEFLFVKNYDKNLYKKYKEDEQNMFLYKKHIENIINENLKIVEKTESINLVGRKNIKNDKFKIETMANESRITSNEFNQFANNYLLSKEKFIYETKLIWIEFQKQFIQKFGSEIVDIANKIAEIDVLNNFANLAKIRGYYKPIFTENTHIKLNNMRHPIVELQTKYIPNTIDLNNQTMVLYGANSAGKSTILRAIALNIIMAQIGCFIPSKAELPIFDAILTRMSSFDAISDGLSTFTLEMTELQSALRFINSKCLFLFDEIGRGTSVEDGEALAYAVLEYLNKENDCITLFATHYHELYNKIKDKNIIIKHLACKNENGKIVFNRNLEDGPGDGSYGIEVAKSCGLPIEIINIAERYRKEYSTIKQSNYNSKVSGILCEICKINPVQETHHINEQKQGKITTYEENGAIKSINNKSNLMMLCASCHRKHF